MKPFFVSPEGVPELDTPSRAPHTEVGIAAELTPIEELCRIAALEAAKQSSTKQGTTK